MHRRAIGVGAALVAVALGAAMARQDRSASVGESFSLEVGESMAIDGAGFSLEFEDVLRDSRCPPDVQCIRAGEAVVVLLVRGAEGSRRLELEVPPGGGVETTHGEWVLRVVSLEPPARAGERLEKSAYVLEVVVAAPEEK